MIKLLSKLFIKNNKDYSNNKVREKYGVLIAIVGINFNVACSALKIIFGFLSNSIAIISDGFNNLSDTLSNVVSLCTFKLANQRPDKEHPYGFGRYEYIGSLIISFIILFMGIELMIDSIKRIIEPKELLYSNTLIIILIITIVIKLYMFIYNRIYSKKINSMVLKTNSLDSLFDAITTSVILGCTLLSKYVEFPLDGIGGLVVSIAICVGGIKIARDAVKTLLGTTPSNQTLEKIKSYFKEEKILGYHDLLLHDYGPGRQYGSVDVEVDCNESLLEIHDIVDRIEFRIERDLGYKFTIHIDPIDNSEEHKILKDVISKTLEKIDTKIKYHDLEIVHKKDKTVVLFDVVTPFDFKEKQNDSIKELLFNKIKEVNSDYVIYITMENEIS